MKKTIKKLATLLLTATMILGTMNIVAAATTERAITYGYTSNISQQLRITAVGYTDVYEPSGGVHVYTYGVKAYTLSYGDKYNTLTTKFTINAVAHSATENTSFSGSGTGEIYKKELTTSKSYNYVTSTVKTSSTVYGSSTQNCNYSC